MPPEYCIEWSGQYENQISVRKHLELVIPIVLVIIFVLLYRTYGSAKEAAHVLLAVPFALSGGIFLVKALGHNSRLRHGSALLRSSELPCKPLSLWLFICAKQLRDEEPRKANSHAPVCTQP